MGLEMLAYLILYRHDDNNYHIFGLHAGKQILSPVLTFFIFVR